MKGKLPNDLVLLARPSPSLDPELRREAEIAAVHAGMTAVEDFSSGGRVEGGWPDLEKVRSDRLLDNPHRAIFERVVLREAVKKGLISDEDLDWWQEQFNQPSEKWDFRVHAFFRGWLERGEEIKSIQRGLERRE